MPRRSNGRERRRELTQISPSTPTGFDDGDFGFVYGTEREHEELQQRGFAFRVTHRRFRLDGLSDFHQTTFHGRAYVERHLGSMFELVPYVDRGGVRRHQDMMLMLMLMRKRTR